jgi:hypothetical protein
MNTKMMTFSLWGLGCGLFATAASVIINNDRKEKRISRQIDDVIKEAKQVQDLDFRNLAEVYKKCYRTAGYPSRISGKQFMELSSITDRVMDKQVEKSKGDLAAQKRVKEDFEYFMSERRLYHM